MSEVRIRKLKFSYPGSRDDVLRDFSLELAEGETVGLLGVSGCGKSTLLRLIAGLDRPDDGSIVVGGTVMADRYTFVLPERRGIGMVFQDYALFPHMTVEQNIAFGLHALKRSERRARIAETLELVKLPGYGRRYPHELSGGQQQRAAFARALAPRPRLLLLDEPFSSLDAELKAGIREEFGALLRKLNITSVLVTHDTADAEALCDRIVRLEPSPPAAMRQRRPQLV